ncbi:MAG: helix-hairpin-helix domain-containing protein, partial [Bacteroidota bacterium]
KPAKVVPPQPDNLKRIEGIGPKIAEALKAAGINSFAKLASMTPEDVKTTLLTQGDRFSFQDTGTWPAQADLAAKGEWDKLKKWQEELKAGKLLGTDGESENEAENEGEGEGEVEATTTTTATKTAAATATPAAKSEEE